MGPTVSIGAILFTDMVGSTELRTRLGDDRADALRRHHDELLAAAVDAHHGTVLRWTGDGIKAAFPAASDCVAAAVQMQRAVAAHNAAADAIAPFEVRIGLAAGEVLIDDDDHHGVTVIEAARLEALARPGEILATDLVRTLGHRRSKVVFEEVGERTLKGLELPVLVHRVLDVAAGVTLALPRTLVSEQRLPLVGRDDELAVLRARWDEARRGTAGLVLVRGRTGVGKTRLVSHCAELAHAEGAIVLAGVCGSDVGVPYQPFAAALAEAASLDDALDLAISQRSGPLARLFPGGSQMPSDAQPALARSDLFDAVASLLRRLSGVHPVVLVLDDLHWAASSTLLLLRHLVEDLAAARLLVIATYRDDDQLGADPLRELTATVRSSPRAAVIDLGILTQSDVVQMVMATVPSEPIGRVAELAQLVHRESAGSPFFASELLHHLVRTGQLQQIAGDGGFDRLSIPDSVHDAVTQRCSLLGQGAEDVLRLAAVIGAEFELDLLAAVCGRSSDDVLDLLDEAGRSGIVAEVGIERFAFAHSIVRSALLDGFSPTRRARAHRRIAEALEAHDPERFDDLALHWRLAGSAERSTVHLARAAERDMAALDFEAARSRYHEVVELLSLDTNADLVTRARAWLGLGAAGRALGDPLYTKAVTKAARLARTARDATLMGEAAALSTWPGTFFFIADLPDRELIELCEDALGLLDDGDPMRVRVLATLSSHLTFASDATRRVELIGEARRLCDRHDDPTLRVDTLTAEFLCLWEPDTLERREQIGREMSRIARATGDPEVEFLGGFFTAYCLTERAEIVSARELLVELIPVSHTTKNTYFTFLAERLILSIDIARCEPGVQSRIDDLLRRYAATHADTDGTWALQTGGLAYQAGTLPSMINAMTAMTAGPLARTWTTGIALAHTWAGELDIATDLLNRHQVVPRNYFWSVVTQGNAEVAAGLRHREHCQRLMTELRPYRGRLGVASSGSLLYALVSRSLGMLALALDDLPDALELFAESVEQADRIGATFEATASRRLQAETLIGLGRSADAAPLLRGAEQMAVSNGFDRERDLVRALRAGRELTGREELDG